MSWDQQAYSFGNPNAQPPTPTQTPTSAVFQNPTFQTPKNNTHTFDSHTGWTPTFAEEYSVFNASPGRLTSSYDPFGEISTPRPTTASSDTLLPSSTEELKAELVLHANHLSTQPTLSLLSIEQPSSGQPSSPRTGSFHGRSPEDKKSEVTPRKPRRRLEEAFSGQTATPPQSATKSARKLAPKLPTGIMQHDEESFHPSPGTSGLPSLLTYSPGVGGMFEYPMSAPATAPAFAKSFWEPDTSMTGMDIDMSFATDNTLLEPANSHRMDNSFFWGRSSQIFQNTNNVHQSDNGGIEPTKRQRPLAPKVSLSSTGHGISSTAFSLASTPITDDPFAMVTSTGAVNPGLLFAFPEGNLSNTNSSKASHSIIPQSRHLDGVRRPYEHQQRELERDEEELRRSRMARDFSAGVRHERISFSSPVKKSNRPGIQRGVSDSRPKTAISQKAGQFTTIAPRPPMTERRATSRGGRISPVKQHRISLSSIPESVPGTRTSVTFSIDANGKARAETQIIAEEPKAYKRRSASIPMEDRDSSHSEYSSDEDPIILPSRNTSFSLPQKRPEGPKQAQFGTSWQSIEERRRSVSSNGTFSGQGSQQGQETDDETITENDNGSGNAANALRKVMEDRKQGIIRLGGQQPSFSSTNRRSNNLSTPRHHQQYNNQALSRNLSPTTVSDPDLETPSTDRKGSRSDTRCVCNNRESDGFMIQCESCEKWLHAKCVGISRNCLPKVYICAFCAQTPNMRGGRTREPARGTLELGSSPLAHKSYKSWR